MILEKIGLNIIYSVTFVQKIGVKALIYHSMFENCFKRVQNSQNRLIFAKPSYWTETFLSTAVPIFLRPWGGGNLQQNIIGVSWKAMKLEQNEPFLHTL